MKTRREQFVAIIHAIDPWDKEALWWRIYSCKELLKRKCISKEQGVEHAAQAGFIAGLKFGIAHVNDLMLRVKGVPYE
jgi:hypothetical protein